jgi:hypothetical protein
VADHVGEDQRAQGPEHQQALATTDGRIWAYAADDRIHPGPAETVARRP